VTISFSKKILLHRGS